MYCLGCSDPIMEWWSNVVGIAAQWLIGDEKAANCLLSRLKNIPPTLASSDDPLPKYTSFRFLYRYIFYSLINYFLNS